MVLRTLAVLVALILSSFSLVGQGTTPLIAQPDEAGYSAAERAALDSGIRDLERLLADWTLGPRRRLGEAGWNAARFAAYTAGALERLGYQTVVVERTSETGAVRTWVLVGLDLGARTAWIPVEPVTDPSQQQTTLGSVARDGEQSGALRFDARYTAYEAVVDLPPNAPPVAAITPTLNELEGGSSAWFGHRSADPDGEIVLYQWTFDDDATSPMTGSSTWYDFPSLGFHTITLTVTDSRGAQASATHTVEVVPPPDNCGCGD